jgi:integral membrane sensor domain MASE1
MRSPASFVQPPRVALWFVQLFAAGPEAESLVGDLLEEFYDLASKLGVGYAKSWFWRQTRKTIAHLIGNAFRVAPGLIAATVIGGFLLNRLVSGLPEPAIFAVLRRYQVYDHHFRVYVFFASDGIAIGHVIASGFVGCVVALAAKRREMVATMTLGFVFCAMTGAAVCVWLATGQTSILGMLPWNLADWFAIVMGGAMVRTHRSAAATLPSNG